MEKEERDNNPQTSASDPDDQKGSEADRESPKKPRTESNVETAANDQVKDTTANAVDADAKRKAAAAARAKAAAAARAKPAGRGGIRRPGKRKRRRNLWNRHPNNPYWMLSSPPSGNRLGMTRWKKPRSIGPIIICPRSWFQRRNGLRWPVC